MHKQKRSKTKHPSNYSNSNVIKELTDSNFMHFKEQPQDQITLRRFKQHVFPDSNPKFHKPFDPRTETDELKNNLKLGDHLSQHQKTVITQFVIEFWDVFRSEGVKTPVQGYKMVIDTGNNKPVNVVQP